MPGKHPPQQLWHQDASSSSGKASRAGGSTLGGSGEEAEEGGKELMTQHVMVMKDISLIDNAVNPTKTVKFRNDLPKKYNEEESYMYDEEREGGEMKTRFSARIGDTRDLAEMMH